MPQLSPLYWGFSSFLVLYIGIVSQLLFYYSVMSFNTFYNYNNNLNYQWYW